MREVFSLRNGHAPRTLFRVANFLFMATLLVLMFIPIVKVLSDSLDLSSVYGLNLWPKRFSLEAYRSIFTNQSLFMPLLVSLLTTVSGTLVGLTLTTLGAYVLRKRDLAGRGFLSGFIFITMIFSGGIIPLFVVLKVISLTNTLWAVILPGALNVFNLILMRNFFETVPESLFESAEMDGASPWIIFTRVVLPLSKAALASIGLFFAVQYWNEFFPYVLFISDTSLYNFQIKLRELVLSDQNLNDPALVGFSNTVKNAAVIVAMLPFFIVYPFVQKYFTSGVTLGAIKE